MKLGSPVYVAVLKNAPSFRLKCVWNQLTLMLVLFIAANAAVSTLSRINKLCSKPRYTVVSFASKGHTR